MQVTVFHLHSPLSSFLSLTSTLLPFPPSLSSTFSPLPPSLSPSSPPHSLPSLPTLVSVPPSTPTDPTHFTPPPLSLPLHCLPSAHIPPLLAHLHWLSPTTHFNSLTQSHPLLRGANIKIHVIKNLQRKEWRKSGSFGNHRVGWPMWVHDHGHKVMWIDAFLSQQFL